MLYIISSITASIIGKKLFIISTLILIFIIIFQKIRSIKFREKFRSLYKFGALKPQKFDGYIYKSANYIVIFDNFGNSNYFSGCSHVFGSLANFSLSVGILLLRGGYYYQFYRQGNSYFALDVEMNICFDNYEISCIKGMRNDDFIVLNKQYFFDANLMVDKHSVIIDKVKIIVKNGVVLKANNCYKNNCSNIFILIKPTSTHIEINTILNDNLGDFSIFNLTNQDFVFQKILQEGYVIKGVSALDSKVKFYDNLHLSKGKYTYVLSDIDFYHFDNLDYSFDFEAKLIDVDFYHKEKYSNIIFRYEFGQVEFHSREKGMEIYNDTPYTIKLHLPNYIALNQKTNNNSILYLDKQQKCNVFNKNISENEMFRLSFSQSPLFNINTGDKKVDDMLNIENWKMIGKSRDVWSTLLSARLYSIFDTPRVENFLKYLLNNDKWCNIERTAIYLLAIEYIKASGKYEILENIYNGDTLLAQVYDFVIKVSNKTHSYSPYLSLLVRLINEILSILDEKNLKLRLISIREILVDRYFVDEKGVNIVDYVSRFVANVLDNEDFVDDEDMKCIGAGLLLNDYLFRIIGMSMSQKNLYFNPNISTNEVVTLDFYLNKAKYCVCLMPDEDKSVSINGVNVGKGGVSTIGNSNRYIEVYYKH
ncbi:MAG: hypothetical protein IKD20_00080 [Clostridia bacterium]|nr:hypothetical protein [Clostridia bacterium]